jgi:hypothetical protein
MSSARTIRIFPATDSPSRVARLTPASASLATRPVADQPAALSSAAGNRLTSAGHALLQLQRQYGNRYVQQVVSQARQAAGSVAGLPAGVRAGIERLSGHSLDNVQVRYNSPSPRRFGALACTNGSTIDVGPGQERHVAHEAWHVVQQLQGRVRPTVQAQGMSLNTDNQLEREADGMGARAALIGRAWEAANDHDGGREIPAPHAHPGEPAGQVTQLKTNLRFSGDVTGENTITATEHVRTGVHKMASDWVLDNGEWSAVPAGTVTNHSKSYESVAQQILEKWVHKLELKKAAKNIMIIYKDLQDHNKGIGTATSTHRLRLQAIRDNPDDKVDVDNIIDSFNYYMYKICDYPANLFMWPDKTDTEPDLPRGEYKDGEVKNWDAQFPFKKAKKRLKDEKGRLADGRTEVWDAIK